MRKRLQEIAFYAGERICGDICENSRRLSPKGLGKALLPLSDLDIVNLNILFNRNAYNGRNMQRASSGLVMGAGAALGVKYMGLYGILASILFN